jgi:hypothetical protein
MVVDVKVMALWLGRHSRCRHGCELPERPELFFMHFANSFVTLATLRMQNRQNIDLATLTTTTQFYLQNATVFKSLSLSLRALDTQRTNLLCLCTRSRGSSHVSVSVRVTSD